MSWKKEIEKRVSGLENFLNKEITISWGDKGDLNADVKDACRVPSAFVGMHVCGLAKEMIKVRKDYEDQLEIVKQIASEKPKSMYGKICGAYFAVKKPIFCCSTNQTAMEMDQLLKDVKDDPNVKEALNSNLPETLRIKDMKLIADLEKENAYIKEQLKSLSKEYCNLDRRKNSYLVEIEKLKKEIKSFEPRPRTLFGTLVSAQLSEKDMETVSNHIGNLKSDSYNQAIDDMVSQLREDTMLGAGLIEKFSQLKKK